MDAWDIILIVSGALALLCLLFSYIAYRITFHATRRQKRQVRELPLKGAAAAHAERVRALMEEMGQLPVEEITIRTYDGIRLVGHYHHAADGAPLYLQFHGYRGCGIRDFCGGNRLARDLGGNTLVVDQRAHGKSDGNTITFGIKERLDCLAWIEYARDRFGADYPIYLTGVSMGAATVLMAAGERLPDNVRGVLADSSYSSPAEIIRRVCGEMGLPVRLVYPFICFGGWLFGGFRLWKYSATDAVSRATVPVLLVHGEADDFVPCEMSEALFAACQAPIKQLETFPEAGHGLGYILDAPRYTEMTADFVRGCEEAAGGKGAPRQE